MKKLAFFLAIFISLNAVSVVRRSEEEEGQAIVQQDKQSVRSGKYTSVIQSLANHLHYYFYAITKEGIFHQISWERIAEIIGKQQNTNKVTRIVYKMEKAGYKEITDVEILC